MGGEPFAVDASMIVADAHRRRGVAKIEDLESDVRTVQSRNIFRCSMMRPSAAATPVEPKVISPTDPAARYTASANCGRRLCLLRQLPHRSEACRDRVDVEATTAIRQAEVGAAKTMLDRTAEQFDLDPVAPGRGWGLRLGRDGRLAGGRARHRAAREPDRQIRAHGRNFLPQRLHIRYRTRPLCLSRSDDRGRASSSPPTPPTTAPTGPPTTAPATAPPTPPVIAPLSSAKAI